MLTQNEITALSLSPTKKDFVQIWNELLEVAGKLSERWDPTSTNESDPGIVILKALTGIADKLNYNIDKNTLEAFMPTAAQEDSMRKLCEMLGYNIKYYRSAETDVVIKYHNSDPSEEEEAALGTTENGQIGLHIPKFTVVSNSDQDINYFTLEDRFISNENKVTDAIPCMEGQLVLCESINDNNVITINQISEKNRFYLPETQIAENGIFIYNVVDLGDGLVDGTEWTKVDNLNTQARNTRVYKFGFDSYEGRPYIEFPEDYSELFNDGIFIYYARTSGASGNVSARTLTKLELPTGDNWSKVSAESFSVENSFAATTGSDIETISQAYNNFKKTIGTFETLVTCRDYMNKIYLMTGESSGRPVVSNIIATDIRSDLNRSVTICSCDGAGIFYKEVPLTETATKKLKLKSGEEVEVIEDEPMINHFDLVLYPFKSYTQIKNNVKDIRKVYDDSFIYSNKSFNEIRSKLDAESISTIAHNIVRPRIGDVICINNYLRLNATIATNYKISTDEGAVVIDKIKIALANAFNMRELDFGEEIPFDSLVKVIEEADSRIRLASLNEPALYTTFSVYEGEKAGVPVIREYAVESDWLSVYDVDSMDRFTYKETDDSLTNTFDTETARAIYNKLAVRNILAGRLPLFDYNKTFNPSFSEDAYQITEDVDIEDIPSGMLSVNEDNPFAIYVKDGITYTAIYKDKDNKIYNKTYTPSVPVHEDGVNDAIANVPLDVISSINTGNITKIEANCEILCGEGGTVTDVKLESGELVKFRAPNFITKKTYPAYVNYHLALRNERKFEAEEAVAYSLFDLLDSDRTTFGDGNKIKWQKVLDYFGTIDSIRGTSFKKTLPMSQVISKYEASAVADNCSEGENKDKPHVDDGSGYCAYCKEKLVNTIQKGDIVVKVENSNSDSGIDELYRYLEKSGCLKLKNTTAKLAWTDINGDTIPKGSTGPNLPTIILEIANPFIVTSAELDAIISALDTRLNELVSQTDAAGKPIMPKECAWTITFDFECVPFEAASLLEWKNLIMTGNDFFDSGDNLFDFEPIVENNNIFWRVYGEGYPKGKYIRKETDKLLKFDATHFGLLPTYRLTGIYLAGYLGRDAQPFIVENNEEYMLKEGEVLYIEYTPSTTTEDGTTQELAAVSEIYEAGTIIRPSGFETGLIDSSVYEEMGHTPFKEVIFTRKTEAGETPISVQMQRFGANEQVEIRDFAAVHLPEDLSDSDSVQIYVYKNFNGCDILENSAPKGTERNYTLKDGEYIFYTDLQKSEFAYFTNGTEVILNGNIYFDQSDIIDISTIFDAGISEIPWQYKKLTKNDTITFKEYQYRTLGKGDTINKLSLVGDAKEISATWNYCADVEYTPAGAKDPESLETINILAGSEQTGCGWEVSSTLTLDVSPATLQTLRNDENVHTKLVLESTSNSGKTTSITIPDHEGVTSVPLAFKTNLNCQIGSNSIDIKDVYSNPNKLKGFELRFFSESGPVIVETDKNMLLPFDKSIVDINDWSGNDVDVKNTSDIWYSVELARLAASEDKGRALRLPINLLPSTYGVFSIYLDYVDKTDKTNTKTWIELLPGVNREDICLLNSKNVWEETDFGYRLYLDEGLNCVSTSVTSKLFIRTDADSSSSGVLYFDELKLVKCKVIEYTEPNGIQASRTTRGLNITQLGYLNTKGGIDETDILDSEALNSLKTDYTNNAIKQLDAKDAEIMATLADISAKVTEMEPKIQKMLTAAKLINAEIDKLISAYTQVDSDGKITSVDTKLISLFEQHTGLYKELQDKKALVELLKEGADAEELAQQVIDLLAGLASIENTQQQLITTLLELKEKLLANTDSLQFSDEDIIKDFELVIGLEDFNTEYPELLKDLQAASNELVNKVYNDQLAAINAELAMVTNFEDRNNLMTLLNNLQETKVAERQANILSLVRQLTEAVDQDQISTDLEKIYRQAQAGNNTEVASLLVTLRNSLNPETFTTIVAEILEAANENADERTSELVEKLTGLIDDSSEPQEDSLIKAIDDLISSIEKDSVSNRVTEVNNIREKVENEYKEQLKALLDEITESLSTSADETYKAKLAELQETKDSQVAEILTKIEGITTTRQDRLDDNLLFSVVANYEDDLYEGRKAAITVWTNYLLAEVTKVIEYLSTELYKIIIDSTKEFTDYANFEINNTERTILIEACNRNAFEEIHESVAELSYMHKQIAAYKSKIESIGNNIQIPVDFSSISESDHNAVILNIINKFNSASSITEKQQLFKSLHSELKNSIDMTKDLVDISAGLLCPSILLFEDKLQLDVVDETCTNFVGYLTRTRDDLLNIAAEDQAITVFESIKDNLNTLVKLENSKILELLKSMDLDKLKDFSEYNTDDLKLLPFTIQSMPETIKTQKSISSNVNLARSAKLFEVLNKDYAKRMLKPKNEAGASLDPLIWVGIDGERYTVKDDKVINSRGKVIDLLLDFAKYDWEGQTFEYEAGWKNSIAELTDDNKVKVKNDDNKWLNTAGKAINLEDQEVLNILNTLLTDVTSLTARMKVTADFKDAYALLKLEELLLSDIRNIDKDRSFYYTAPTDLSLAIDFNESNKELNTLMNPARNYDVNNINNNFVISKLDIDYLDRGLQIARSSRLN